MTTVEKLIKRCIETGVSLILADGDNLDIHATENALTPDLMALLKRHKPELIAWLKRQSTTTALPADYLPAIGKASADSVESIDRAQPLSYPQEGLWLTDRIGGSL